MCLYPASRRGKRPRTINQVETQDTADLSSVQIDRALVPNHNTISSTHVAEVTQDSGSSTSGIQCTQKVTVSSAPGSEVQWASRSLPQEASDIVVDEVIPLHKVNYEHHGPHSWASVCSQPGLKWVCERTRSEEFVDIGNSLVKTWSRRLKMPRFQPFRASRVPDPDKCTAFRYVQAYFDQSYDAVFGVLHESKFKARLEAHFDGHGAFQMEDPSWFALRNVVYALGCRCMMAADDKVSFVDAEAQAKLYFHNALSSFSEVIFGHSGFTAIQALVLMTFYAEGLGNAAIEFPLCSNAVQLAQARGLHRAPSKSWGLSESDSLSRSWLWWTIYCLEKQIAFRSGRPSLIDDDNISTPIPTKAPPGSTMDVGIFTLIIQNARISAQVSSRIMSVKAFGQSSTQIIETVHDIRGQLEKLLGSIPLELRMGTPVIRHECQSAQRQIPMMYLHCAIFGSLMATHSVLFYPWVSARFGTDTDPSFQDRITASSEIVANAARQIVLMLRKLTTNAAVPAWLAFYFPIYAHINLFVHTLMYPAGPNAIGDLALMDICAGHFGHVEHITGSEVAFHFPRESAALCAKLVKGVKGTERANLTTVPATPQPFNTTLDFSRANEILNGRGEALQPSEPYELGNPFDPLDLDMESWNFFSSIDIIDSLTPNLIDIASVL